MGATIRTTKIPYRWDFLLSAPVFLELCMCVCEREAGLLLFLYLSLFITKNVDVCACVCTRMPTLSLLSSVCFCLCIAHTWKPAQSENTQWLAGKHGLYPSYHLFLSFALSFIPAVQLLPFLKFSFLLNVCHLCHLSMVLRSPIPSFALHAILSFSCFTLLEN